MPAFHLLVGGGFQDLARIAVPVMREVPVEEVPQAVERLLRFYLDNRLADDSFTDFTKQHTDAELETIFGAAAATATMMA